MFVRIFFCYSYQKGIQVGALDFRFFFSVLLGQILNDIHTIGGPLIGRFLGPRKNRLNRKPSC